MAVISATFARSERLTADYYLNITRIGPRQRGGDAVGALPAAEKGAVGGREMLGRAGFAGEKQAVVDGRRQHGALGCGEIRHRPGAAAFELERQRAAEKRRDQRPAERPYLVAAGGDAVERPDEMAFRREVRRGVIE